MQIRILTLTLLLVMFSVIRDLAQTLGPEAADYNAPYDTLMARGDKALASGKIIGAQSPALALMFYNRAIEINKQRTEAYGAKGTALLDYNMLDDAKQSFNAGLAINPKEPRCLYGIFWGTFLQSRQYELAQIPTDLLNNIYKTAQAFIPTATPALVQERLNAKLIGNVYKLGVDNKDLFLKFNANNAGTIEDANAQALESMIEPVKALNNLVVGAAIYDNLIDYYFARGNYAKVKEYASKSIASGEAFTNTYHNLAWILYNQDKNATEALKVIAASEKYAPNNNTANLKLTIFYDLGKKAYAAKDLATAITHFNNYVKEFTGNERAFAWLGFANFEAKKYADASKALKTLKKTAQPETAAIYYPNVDALIAFADKPGAAAPAVQNGLAENEKQEEAFRKALELFDQGKTQECIAAMAAPIAYFEQTKNPVNLSWAYMQQGYISHTGKDYAKAQEWYKKSIAAGGYEEYAYRNLGLIQFAVDGNYTESEKVLMSGIAKFPGSRAVADGLAQLYATQGNNAFDAKDYATAVQKYSQSVQYSDNAETYTFLGFSYYYQQENAKCIEALETAVYLNPDIVTTYPAINQVLSALK